MLASLMILDTRAYPSRVRMPSSSGLELRGSSDIPVKRLWIAGSATAAAVSAFNRSITAFGVPFGANRPIQVSN